MNNLERIQRLKWVLSLLNSMRGKVAGLGPATHGIREVLSSLESGDKVWLVKPKVLPEFTTEFAVVTAGTVEEAYGKLNTDSFLYAKDFESFEFEDITDGYYYFS